jgi:hypothetical protein
MTSTTTLRHITKVPTQLLHGFIRDGLSERSIVQHLLTQGLQISKSAVHRSLQAERVKHIPYQNKIHKCQNLLSERAKRYLTRLVRVHGERRTASLHQHLLQQGFKVSNRTVRRALHSVPTLRLVHPRQRPFLSKHHLRQRYQWAQAALARRIDWTKVFFVDEKIWQLDGPVRRFKVWHDKRDAPPLLPRTGTRNRAIAVWGAFSLNAVPSLVRVPAHLNSEQYCDITARHLVPKMPRKHRVLYHDRLTAHCSKATNAWMKDHGIRANLFPAKAADLNPIENLWSIVSHRVFSGTRTYVREDDLVTAIEAAWTSIQKDRALRSRLIDTMQRRLTQVVQRKGGCADF